MTLKNWDYPIVSATIAVMVVIVVVVGGIITITNPQTESFSEYVATVTVLASALGIATGIAVHNHKGDDKRE